MRVSQVTVSLQKRVNDGDYGSEMAEAQYVVLVDEGEDADEVVRMMLDRARGQVFRELGASNNSSVLRRLNPPKPIVYDRINPAGFDTEEEEDDDTVDEISTADAAEIAAVARRGEEDSGF